MSLDPHHAVHSGKRLLMRWMQAQSDMCQTVCRSGDRSHFTSSPVGKVGFRNDPWEVSPPVPSERGCDPHEFL